MELLIRMTTSPNWAATVDDAEPGEAARGLWQRIAQGRPIEATVAQSPGGQAIGDANWVLLNPAHVVSITER